jgi:uncharacterized membrane protein YhaH (DUF805 family)
MDKLKEFFGTWFIDVLKGHYADFDGRVSKQQFWMYILAYFILSVVVGIVGGILGVIASALTTVITSLFSLALIVPTIAIGVRRLHDIGKSGWLYLIAFIPLIGIIFLIVLWIKDGEVGDNAFGADPQNA